MPQVFANAARAVLTAPTTADGLTLEVDNGSVFPVATYAGTDTPEPTSTSDWFKVVIQSDDTFEVAYCRMHTAGSTTLSNVQRGMEGTTGVIHPVGSVVGLRLLASDSGYVLSALETKSNTNHTHTNASPSLAGFMSAQDKEKLDTVQSGAQVNVGTNLNRSPSTTTINLTSSTGTGTSLPAATQTAAGVLTAADKTKLDNIEAGANNYSLPAATASEMGGVKLGNATVQTVAPASVSATAARSYAVQITSGGQLVVNVPWVDTNTTYGVVTTSVNGLMASTDKTKLDGIATGANNFALPTGSNGQVLKHNGTDWVAGTDNNTTYSNMSQAEADAGTATTGRLVQPTVLKAAILKHAPAPTDVTTSASGLMTAADKVKLNGIETGATKDWTATSVPSGADLNTYQTPGSYFCSSNATSATLLNCPTSLAFTLRVWQAAGYVQEIQEYHSGNGGGLRRWTRGYYGSGAWSAWDEVVTKRYPLTPEELLPTATTNQILKFNGTNWIAAADANTTYSAMSATEANAGTATSARVITAAVLKGAIDTHAVSVTGGSVEGVVTMTSGASQAYNFSNTSGMLRFTAGAYNTTNLTLDLNADKTAKFYGDVTAPTFIGALTGNASTATTLATVRQINGTNFNGSANITTANWGTARTLTIGSTGKSVNGSANVSWTLAEIGAAAASHTHSYLPLAGGSLSGSLSVTGDITATGNITAYSDIRLKTDLESISNAVERVKNLTGYTFTRKDTGERQTGLVAQDVLAMLPEAVLEKDGFLSVNYGSLVGLLVNAIKELDARVKELEK